MTEKDIYFMRREKLWETATKLIPEALKEPTNVFDMGVWFDDEYYFEDGVGCGTIGCLAGWYAHFHPEEGLSPFDLDMFTLGEHFGFRQGYISPSSIFYWPPTLKDATDTLRQALNSMGHEVLNDPE